MFFDSRIRPRYAVPRFRPETLMRVFRVRVVTLCRARSGDSSNLHPGERSYSPGFEIMTKSLRRLQP